MVYVLGMFAIYSPISLMRQLLLFVKYRANAEKPSQYFTGL